MSKIGDNIKKFRIFRKMTQIELGEAVNRSKNVVSNWERGDNTPDLDTLEKLCVVLDVTPNQLFGWDKNPEYERHQERVNEYRLKLAELEQERKRIESIMSKLKSEYDTDAFYE